MTSVPVSFERNVLPLFRAKDIRAMSFAFDLSQPDDVRAHAEEILRRLEEGSMPCDAMWQEGQVELFRTWIRDGMSA